MELIQDLGIICRKLAARTTVRIVIAVLLLLGVIWAFRRYAGGPLNGKQAYQVALNNNWAPIQLFGKEPNLGAFVVDLMTTIVQQEDLNVNLFNVRGGDLFQSLDNKIYDGIIVTNVPNTYLEDKYLFSKPFYRSGPVLVVPDSSEVKSLQDLSGQPVGIQKGSSLLFQFPQDRSSMLFISYDNMNIAIEDLISNVLSGVIMEMPLAYTYANGFYAGKIKIATPPLTNLGIRLVTLWDPPGEDLVERVNAGLKKSQENGTYKALIEKWELVQPLPTTEPN
jgi:ABC-type amino acid transport substrate-binding protein